MRWNNIVLVGFMGTGKTTVGQALADRLGWKLVGTDEEIERQEECTIPELFTKRGEAYFRAAESRIVAGIMAGSGQVVATGGGAVLAADNRAAMLAGGLVVALEASAETIIARVSGDANRPLLQGNPREFVPKLMEQRKHAYDFADVKIATDGKSVATIVADIVRQAEAFERK